MKTLTLKFVWLLSTLITLSCCDQFTALEKVDHSKFTKFNRWADNGSVAPLYDGSDSGPIDNAIATAWIKNFSSTARTTSGAYYFPRHIVENIIAQDGCTGIRVYYGNDDDGETTLVISGVDAEGENIIAASPLLAVSQDTFSETGGAIGVDEAHDQIMSFQSTIDPSEIRSHYFGINGILLVLEQENCFGLKIYQALNEANEQKLLIVGLAPTADDSQNSGLGRPLTGGDSTIVLPVTLDFSFPCPSVCGQKKVGPLN